MLALALRWRVLVLGYEGVMEAAECQCLRRIVGGRALANDDSTSGIRLKSSAGPSAIIVLANITVAQELICARRCRLLSRSCAHLLPRAVAAPSCWRRAIF